MSRLVGVIPAAGRGTRAYPYTRGIPKCMLEIDGEPILARTLAIFRDQMGVTDVVVVVNDLGHVIRERFGDGSRLGLNLVYVANDAVDRGLGYSVLLSRPHVEDRFAVILSDECYLDSNHDEMVRNDDPGALAVCAVARPADPEQVRKNYAVEAHEGVVRRLVEKPREVAGAYLGLGTFLFDRRIYRHLERALESRGGEPNDLVSVLGRACRDGERVRAFELAGRYFNVNDRDELNLANNVVRGRQFAARSRSMAVVMRGSLERTLATVEEFRRLGTFQQLLLVLPPSIAVGRDAAGDAETVVASSEEFGAMMRAGLDAATGDILFTVYGDGSFAPGDVAKFLEYLKEADLVTGTRTTRQLIHQGSNMRGVVRLVQVGLAKFLELVWWGHEPRFTDLGCAYRAMWRSTYRMIRPHLESDGPAFSVEMLIETLRCRKRVIEIPVNFSVWRRGLKERDQNWHTALSMLAVILKRRLGSPRSEPDSRDRRLAEDLRASTPATR
jgi:dTDP-glucose pyrophosphorylase